MAASAEQLDAAFNALANSTRRKVVERLADGPATVSELAEPFDMALPSFMQHLRTLERAGLIQTTKAGRVRTVRIKAARLRVVTHWIDAQRVLWERRLDQLDSYLHVLDEGDDETT